MARGALPQGVGTRSFTGARCVFMFNESPIGFATGVSGSEEIMYEGVDVLDDLAVKEHAPTGYRVTLNASMVRTIARGPSTDDSPGSIKEQNIFPRFAEILKVEGVTAAVQDSVSGKIVALYKGVKTASYNWNATARGLVAQNVTFVAIQAFDEAEIGAKT